MLLKTFLPNTIYKALPVLLLSLPIYFIAKYLEKKILPRKSLKHFFIWIVMVIGLSLAYFYSFMSLAKFFKWDFWSFENYLPEVN